MKVISDASGWHVFVYHVLPTIVGVYWYLGPRSTGSSIDRG